MWLLFHWVYSVLFIYLLLAALDLRYCMGFSLVAGRGLLTVVATLLQSTGSRAPRLQGVVALGLSNGSSHPLERRLRDCGADAQFPRRVIFLDQESNLYLLHWPADSLPLSHQGNPKIYS